MELLTQASIHLFDERLPTCVLKQNVTSVYKSELGAGGEGQGQVAMALAPSRTGACPPCMVIS